MTSYKEQLENIKEVKAMLSDTSGQTFQLSVLRERVLRMAADLKEYVKTAQEEDGEDGEFVVPDDESVSVESGEDEEEEEEEEDEEEEDDYDPDQDGEVPLAVQ